MTPIRRNKFNFRPYKLATCDMGQLIPIGMFPVLPNDMVGMTTNLFMRLAPLAAPVMHQVDVRVHHYYAANRILWDGWEDFWTGGEDGMNTDTIPQIPTTGTNNDLFDYLGVDPNAGPGINLNSLPVIMYNRIVNEHYRDQDLQPTLRADLDTSIARICWEKDYASTARPWSQKGPAVSIPLGDSADVYQRNSGSAASDLPIGKGASNADGHGPLSAGPAFTAGSELFADLSGAVGADPIDVRRAWGIQRFMENAARFGSRYPEKLRQLGSAYKGLLERPEFLAGGSQAVSFSEVLQTANDDALNVGVGDMYGHGITSMKANRFVRRMDESGYVMTLLSVRPRAVYQDGVDREWLKLDREDFHDPFLEEIGMQPLYYGEVDLDHASGERAVMGYTDRYEEYRRMCSGVSGEFRDQLNYWHLARNLTDPELDDTFVECNPDKRIFQDQTSHGLWCMAHHNISINRNLTKVARNELI